MYPKHELLIKLNVETMNFVAGIPEDQNIKRLRFFC